VNQETITLDPALYTGDHFHKIPPGAKNGLQNGEKFEGLRPVYTK
jgi:hypothetical protein